MSCIRSTSPWVSKSPFGGYPHERGLLPVWFEFDHGHVHRMSKSSDSSSTYAIPPHAGSETLPVGQHNDDATCHIFAAIISDALQPVSGVPYGKAFACYPPEVTFWKSLHKSCITNNNIVLGTMGSLWRVNNQMFQAFADVIIGVTLQFNGNTL